jgi:hypothetical protein
MEILVWEDKYGTSYYDASTPEALEKSALKILRQLLNDRYIVKPENPLEGDNLEYSGIDLEQARLTLEQIEALPTEGLRKDALAHRKRLANRIRSYQNQLAEYNAIQKVLAGEEVYARDWVRKADTKQGKKGDVVKGRRITAWSLLQMRNGAEYEHFSIEVVQEADA